MKTNNYVRLALFVTLFQVFSWVPASAQYILSRHESIVREFADQIARSYCRQINPNTGSDAYARVKSWTYDEYKGSYYIDLELYWSGRPWAFADRTTYEVDGRLTVKANGQNPSFSETWSSRSVQVTKDNSNLFGAIAVGTALYVAASQGR